MLVYCIEFTYRYILEMLNLKNNNNYRLVGTGNIKIRQSYVTDHAKSNLSHNFKYNPI